MSHPISLEEPTATTIQAASVSSLQSLEELQLLDDNSFDSCHNSKDHELNTAPILTRDAYITVVSDHADNTTQYGVLGRAISIQ